MSSPAEELALVLPTPQSSFVVQRTQVPTKVTPSDLLVKIHSTALNPADWKIAKYGLIVTPKDYPAILGFDAAGEVAELGAGVKGWAKGDRV
jgi:NADPH:quinone reductase-like Zn-dependent oxidoreductase